MAWSAAECQRAVVKAAAHSQTIAALIKRNQWQTNHAEKARWYMGTPAEVWF